MDAQELETPQPANKRKPLPIVMARGPQEYLPGHQEDPVLTTVDDMLRWAQNWVRSRYIWPFTYALACCGIEMIATASAPQYDLSRFGSEVFRASPRQADLMIVAGTLTVKIAPRLRHLWEQVPEPKWVISMGQCANSGVSSTTVTIVSRGWTRSCPSTSMCRGALRARRLSSKAFSSCARRLRSRG